MIPKYDRCLTPAGCWALRRTVDLLHGLGPSYSVLETIDFLYKIYGAERVTYDTSTPRQYTWRFLFPSSLCTGLFLSARRQYWLAVDYNNKPKE